MPALLGKSGLMRRAAHPRDWLDLQTLKAGVPVFYLDAQLGLDVMEQPNGRRFEIRFIPGAPGESNYRIIRELDQPVA